MAKIEVACYHWSAWHKSKKFDTLRGKDWTEWEYLKKAFPRFPGHKQPRIPMWGYLDDSEPAVIQNQIDTACEYGIDAFIFDWGYNGDEIAFQNYLKAPNRNKLKFAIMNCGGIPDMENTRGMYEYILDNFMSQDNYWKIDGACYYSIYELHKQIKILGGIENTKKAYDMFRELAEERNIKLHLVAVEWGLQGVEEMGYDANEVIKTLSFDAVTSYVWAHNTVPKWPMGDYTEWAETAYDKMLDIEKKYDLPYYTHVSAGWDTAPRCPEDMRFEEGGPLMYHNIVTKKYDILHTPYFSTIIYDNTPEKFRNALLAAKRHLIDTNPKNKIVTLYAWNEWTEGGYLEPDAEYGYGKLEAIKSVFGSDKE